MGGNNNRRVDYTSQMSVQAVRTVTMVMVSYKVGVINEVELVI